MNMKITEYVAVTTTSNEYKQLSATISGSSIRLNFPVKSDGKILDDVKKTILRGAIKM